MADSKIGNGKKISTVGIKDSSVRKIIEQLAKRVADLETVALTKGW